MSQISIVEMRLIIVLSLLFLPWKMSAQFNERAVPDYYLQYVPVAAGVGLGWTGVTSENPGFDRALVTAAGMVSEFIIVNSLKYTVREQRPDGSAFNSFPSGHSATAFLGAEIVRHEYGWGWGSAAYAVAGSVAALRVYHDRHYWWDTLAGAGCGILSANIGYWLKDPIRRVLGLDEDVTVALSPRYDPISATLGPSLLLRF